MGINFSRKKIHFGQKFRMQRAGINENIRLLIGLIQIPLLILLNNINFRNPLFLNYSRFNSISLQINNSNEDSAPPQDICLRFKCPDGCPFTLFI